MTLNTKIQSLKRTFRYGLVPAMATPLDPAGQVDEAALERLIEFLIAAGCDGLFVGGTTGEGILLSLDERKRLHEISLAVNAGRIPILLHVGANDTGSALALARHAEENGADGIVAVTPTYYPVHDQALAEYYEEIARSAPNTPLLFYDIPHMAVNGISPGLVSRYAPEIATFAGIKCSRPDAQMIRKLIDVTREAAGGRAIFMAGNERIALGSLALGADGLISGLSTAIPEPFIAMCRAFAAGDVETARAWQITINRILDLLPEGVRIGAVKALLAQRGIPVGPPVPPRPLPAADWQVWPAIETLLNEIQNG